MTAPTRADELRAGNATLTVTVGETPLLRFNPQAGLPAECPLPGPLLLTVLSTTGSTHELSGTYDSVESDNAGLQCQGQLTTPAGSVFLFNDRYTATDEAIELERRVAVESVAAIDEGFVSSFKLGLPGDRSLSERELFIPGICYRKNAHVPAHALAADLSEESIVVREDRMPLPLVMTRDPGSGFTAALIHLAPDGSTSMADAKPERLVDARLQFASLGIAGQAQPALTIKYPGIEGQRTYLKPRGQRRDTHGWSERFHPVRKDIDHAYKLRIELAGHAGFPAALRSVWRSAFERIHPAPTRADIAGSYDAGMKLVAAWAGPHDGHYGLPFRLKLPEGRLEGKEHLNFQMGFVGQQLPLAYHLIRRGIETQDAAMTRQGEAMVDFWAKESRTPAGLPRTWFDTFPKPHWRDYNTFLRVASDGMTGALRAWDIMAWNDHKKPEWLRFCRGFGDWLVKQQNPDGSWFREFRQDGTPVDRGKQNTSHPIPFLLGLAIATGDGKYRAAALRAGDFCWRDVHEAFAYVGGTADNPNVIDKEAGFLALDAFLALHDATGDARWLEAASRAADFTETWAYCWNVPMPEDDPAVVFPKGAATTGFSVIATGHSGADLFLAGAPFLYYRLYLKTGDRHYAEFARQLLHDTRQSVDIDGSLGYGHTGLCTEAVSLASPRGRGVNTWLPWLTYSMVDPVANLQDAFRMTDMPVVEGERLEELRARDRSFGRVRGLRSAIAK
ncbi:hypothetical protein [Luteolibacter marinus]|uniref:hypothetical protein n=1 Tax=Luteolibacter marinus TaxID=2776705 RepID=UPI001D019732|nr:hypothetical protein [Luteolibacter marinus]